MRNGKRGIYSDTTFLIQVVSPLGFATRRANISIVATQRSRYRVLSPSTHNEPSAGAMPQTAVFLQKACLQHRYIRTRDNSHIVERPERLRAVNIGLAATVARLEEVVSLASPSTSGTRVTGPTALDEDADDLTKALGKLQLEAPSRPNQFPKVPVAFVHSDASAELLSHPAVKFVHGDIERDIYLEALTSMAKDSQDKVSKGESEIPEGYSQGDLYRKLATYSRSRRPVNACYSVTRITRCYTGCSWDHMRGSRRGSSGLPQSLGHLNRFATTQSSVCCDSPTRTPLRRGSRIRHMHNGCH